MGLIRVTPFFAGSKVIAMSTEWGVAPFMTECSEQPVIDDAISKKVGYAWYDYSGPCNVPWFWVIIRMIE